jgi:hypothetical protein
VRTSPFGPSPAAPVRAAARLAAPYRAVPYRAAPCLAAVCLVAVCLAAFTAACSAQGPAEGTLTGHLYGVGGPAPGLPRPWPGKVILNGPNVHLDLPVGASGAFSVPVPPGRYTLIGYSPQYESGAVPCRPLGVATVTSGHSTTADIWCQMS